MSISAPDKDDDSDKDLWSAGIDTKFVMAEQLAQDVVKEAQSMGDSSPIDATATTTKNSAGDGEAPSNSTTANPKPSDVHSTASTNDISAKGRELDGVDGVVASGEAKKDSASSPVDSVKQDSGVAIPKEDSQNLVNGDSGEHSVTEDGASQHILADASGGSDTDISRPESVEQGRPGAHLRSNSVKKPTSFKSVSVTKNFLAKSAVSTPSPRPGDKVSSAGQTNASTQQTAKPRLVAKSGSGLGNISRSSLSKMNGNGGPDASKVWNKNQPVPPPPPKHLTDEELKTQYGIHLATRLQADEEGKEAKWADIDDDEDDWAPDTVQWMDGTKSTVAAVENVPPPPEEPKPSAPKKEAPTEPPKPTLTPSASAQKPTTSIGTKTILKPGAHTLGSGHKSGLVLKGQSEKPTLVAKPSAPAPVKSPWAPLPPVEKVSPVQINPPVPQPPPVSRFSQRDPHGFDALPPVNAATKELAPDDFNRSWRDERGTKELFNSHSGRYEPVNDMRRGSLRDREHGFQRPSVLQRPSQGGPAEPSPAFQTSRTSADGPMWGRRRTSSNISGGSGRRMSIDRRAEDLPPIPLDVSRRGSHSVMENAVTPGRPSFGPRAHPSDHSMAESSPNVSSVQPHSPFGSVDSAAPPEMTPGPGPQTPAEDPVEVQNRLIQESRERARLAKQREKEREEQEEAARKERLRKKLEAMGPTSPDEGKSKEKELTDEKSPQKERAVPAPIQSPPKPPVPTSEGEVAQYGMMKVHQPHPVRRAGYTPPPPTQVEPKSSMRPQEHAPKRIPSPVKGTAGVSPTHGPNSVPPYAGEGSVSLNNDNRLLNKDNRENNSSQPPHFQRARVEQPEGQVLKPPPPHPSTWKPSSTQQPQAAWSSLSNHSTSNVWGPPQNKDRALGNGTFDTSYNRSHPHHSSQPPQSQIIQPGPIGLPPSLKLSPAQSQATPYPVSSYTPSTMGLGAPTEVPAQQQQQQQQQQQHPRLQNMHRTPGPIAPPKARVSAWGGFSDAIAQDDAAYRARLQDQNDKAAGTASTLDLKEKFRPREDTRAPVKKVPAENVPAPHLSAPAHTEVQSETPGTTQVKSSRFFPRANETTSQHSTASNKSNSPPPPETEAHPAHGGNVKRPQVNLPKPAPRVKLPPPAVQVAPVAAANPVTMPNPVGALGARPLTLDPEWQARFNGLFGRTQPVSAPAVQQPVPVEHTAPKPSSLAVAPSSKVALDVRHPSSFATVSLPATTSKKTFAVDSSQDVVSRVTAEEALLEDREFGSLPTVKLPTARHLAAAEPPVAAPTVRPYSRFNRNGVDVLSKEYIAIDDRHTPAGIEVVIRLANMGPSITKLMPRNQSHKTGGYNNRSKRNFTPKTGANNAQNPRSRKQPNNYQGQGPSSQGSSPRPVSNNNAPRASNSWSNSRNNSNTWSNKRAAPAVVH